MKHYLFKDIETCEEFLVGADNQHEAIAIAKEVATKFKCFGTVSEFEAEASGLDEY
jgi:hypothetical protein